MKRSIIIPLLLLLCQSTLAISFRHYNSNNGLIHNTVLGITQDNKGFMWFSTPVGITKFDGKNFYPIYFRDYQQIKSRWFGDQILSDEHGDIWVTSTAQVGRYNIKKDTISFWNNKTSFEGRVVSIQKTFSNKLMLLTSKKLYHFSYKHQQFTPIKIPSYIKGVILQFFEDRKGKWWFYTPHKLWIVDPNDNHKLITTIDNLPTSTIIAGRKYHFAQDRQENVYLTIPQHGIYIINSQTFKIKKITTATAPSCKGLNNDIIRCITLDEDNNIYLGTENGVNYFSPESEKVKHYSHNINDPNTLSDNAIYDIFIDKHNNVWVASFFGGVSVYLKNRSNFEYYNAGAPPKHLKGKAVSQIFEDEKKNLWVASEDGGMSYFNTSTQQFSHLNLSKTSKPLNINACYSTNDTLVIGTWFNGLFRTNLRSPNKSLKKILHESIALIFPINKSELLIGSPQSTYTYNIKTEKLQPVFEDIEWPNARCVIRTKNNLILIGTDRNGIFRYIPETKTCIPYLSNLDEIPYNIISLRESEDGLLWIGTFEDGLYQIDTSKKTVKNFTSKNGLMDNTIYSIIEDEKKRLWLTSNKGLSCFNRKTNTFFHFTNHDGLPINQFNYYSSLLHSSGKIYFGTINGMIAFNPLTITHNGICPEIQFTELFINNKKTTANTPNNILNKSITETKEITLNHTQNNFAITFAAIDYTSPENTKYACKMEGLDKSWIELGKHNKATYSKLPPGNYTFKVRAKTNPNIWNTQPKSIRIIVLPSFWQSKWGYFVYILLFIVALILYLYFLRQKEKARTLLQIERIEKNKIKELNRLKTEFFTNISHEFKTPLSLINDPLKRMANNEISTSETPQMLNLVLRNVERLSTLINHILNHNKSEMGGFQLTEEPILVISFLENITQRFLVLSKDKQINFITKYSVSDNNYWIDPEILDTIITNLLSNAFKFTPDEGIIELHAKLIESENPTLQFIVSDSGIGIDKDKQEKIFSQFYKVKSNENDQIGTGIGLSLSKHLTELHQGTITVKSEKGVGTTFYVNIPAKVAPHTTTVQNLNPLPDSIPKESEKKVSNPKEISDTKILIVEDNKDLQQYLKQLLEDNYQTHTANDGEEAWKLLSHSHVDIIVSDVMMPKLDGFELCKKVKTNLSTSHVPVILLTAKTEEQDKIQGLNIGADLYLSKPFNSKILLTYISNILTSRQNFKNQFQKEMGINISEITYSNKDEEFIQQAVKIIFDNMQNEKFDVKQFVILMGISKSLFYSKIKEISGVTPTQFIQSIRMKEAARLLQSHQFNINEVATQVGFSDPAYFSRCFKKQFSSSPSDFLKQTIK